MSEMYFRLRVCHGKTGRLRHLSHLEVVRATERAVRRTGVPYAITKGFNPHMRIAFGPALPVGTAGLSEYYDLWLLEPVPAGDALSSLRSAIAADLAPVRARYVQEKERSLSAALTRAVYDVRVQGESDLEGGMRSSVASVVAEGTLAVDHKGRTKVFELASTLPKEPDVRSAAGEVVVTVTTRIGEGGALRPEALVKAALARSATAGRIVSVTRTDLFVEEAGSVRRPL